MGNNISVPSHVNLAIVSILWNFKLQITNISRKLTEDGLREIFAAYGSISECSLVLDSQTGKSKGFGFIVMKDEESGLRAIKELTGFQIDNIKLKIKVLKS